MYISGDFILTTANSVEGYRIVEQCGLVFGETVFKHGFLNQLGASVMNTVDSVKWGSREMSGSMSLIENAREYAYNKMINEAKKRGANAIIAIDTDNTFGGSVMYLSLYGTAVKIMPEKEYEEQRRIEAEKQEQERIELQQKEYQFAALLDEAKQRKAGGDIERETEFLKRMRGMDSAMKIWKLWTESGLGSTYREIDSLIKRANDRERMYGKLTNDTNNLKDQIEKTLLEV